MNRRFDVYLDHQVAGFGEIIKQGLYYNVHCRCKLTDNKVYRLLASCGERTVDLGICVPFEDGFGVDKMIPIKKLNEDGIVLHLSRKQDNSDRTFVPLNAEKPFGAMEYLMCAKFERRGDTAGLLIIGDQLPTVI